MKKLLFSVTLLFMGLMTSFSQTTKSFFAELGGTYSTFQDVKFSAVSYGGVGATLKFGWQRDYPNALWNAGLDIGYGNESPNTHGATKSTVIHPKLFGRYLRKINDQWAVGGHWDILGLNIRNTEGLDNNGTWYLTHSDLFASGTYQRGKFNFGLDLGLLTFFKERTSFAFSAPQKGLEDGDFDYQDEALDSPFGFKYFSLNALFNHLNLRTKITYQFNDRLSVGYQWQVRHFAVVENYPVTMGNHQVLVRYNIIHKTKSDSTPKK